jgi:hypothetical protein
MIIQLVTGGQRDQGLAQHVFMPAVHGLRATPAGSLLRNLQLLTGEGGQRRLLHGCIFPEPASRDSSCCQSGERRCDRPLGGQALPFPVVCVRRRGVLILCGLCSRLETRFRRWCLTTRGGLTRQSFCDTRCHSKVSASASRSDWPPPECPCWRGWWWSCCRSRRVAPRRRLRRRAGRPRC